jgi:hypothetical protein
MYHCANECSHGWASSLDQVDFARADRLIAERLGTT